MATPLPEPSQLGLLDLTVDLSVPQVYSGTDFTVYLHVKNPFAVPVWIDSVELSLPTQLSWRAPESEQPADAAEPDAEALRTAIRQRDAERASLERELTQLGAADHAEQHRIVDALGRLEEEHERDLALLHGGTGQLHLTANENAVVNLHGRARQLHITANDDSVVNVYDPLTSGRERVPLVGSLPKGTALEPGCTDVWTIRLGTGRSPFFVPASYHLQVTVIYGLMPHQGLVGDARPDRPSDGQHRRRVFSNTTSLTVPLKAALWNVMAGGALGGAVGSIGRSVQDARTLNALVEQQLGTAIGSLVLAVILSGAAIVFAARKSEAQSFVTVEDFWGGLLIGFLIGYSGTAAFAEITGVRA
ncbi:MULTISPECIES: hypothetical protein [unclassified Kitasatospora]|uniref:hypothetical protein n=1 Tax=unclassified Kitasatospora TaxID=2633591 RepID=UPI00070A20C0|nr:MULTISPECIES: hypothetical protein [unclassified Kitasatospora]KQV20100.1 hypothetical protein ASC99_22195 [Kitasatospora sp. Root107]KRB71172.1 hypothetical protein ASE03_24375 [Kitasatospora sp. Root187]